MLSSILKKALMAMMVLVSFSSVAQANHDAVDINTTVTGLAIRGYDPVAYFTQGEPTPGDVSISADYNGATYRFASEENRETFLADPEHYVPQYGGFCAFGTAMGFKFDGDPHAWTIVDDKLYLNLSTVVRSRWQRDVPGFIKSANEKWPEIKDVAPSDLNG